MYYFDLDSPKWKSQGRWNCSVKYDCGIRSYILGYRGNIGPHVRFCTAVIFSCICNTDMGNQIVILIMYTSMIWLHFSGPICLLTISQSAARAFWLLHVWTKLYSSFSWFQVTWQLLSLFTSLSVALYACSLFLSPLGRIGYKIMPFLLLAYRCPKRW